MEETSNSSGILRQIFAIDPGPEQSGWIGWYGDDIQSGVEKNEEIRWILFRLFKNATCFIEQFEPRGKSLGSDSISTIQWTGRFQELLCAREIECRMVGRSRVKLELLGTTKATKADIRAKVIEILGVPGTKKAPGSTYGVKSHAWDALALAIYGDRLLRGWLEYK